MQKVISSSPHLRDNATTSRIMLDVIIALIPAGVCAVYFFGLSALLNILLAVGSAVAAEAIVEKCCGKPVTVADLSAVLTGFLLALNLPSGVPFYIPICGSVFAIIVAKQVFGGLGCNFVNPALAGRAFLLISWPVAMTTWTMPFTYGADAVSTATPLAVMEGTSEGVMPSLWDMFSGNIPGSMGEVCTIALLAGAAYLFIRRVISFRIPVAFIGTVAVISLIYGLYSGDLMAVPYNLLAGGVVLGAFFMATDYVTSPVSGKAQVLFGIGCGGVTMVIRLFGGYPEGVSFAILFMNLLTPLLDLKLRDRVFGEVKSK